MRTFLRRSSSRRHESALNLLAAAALTAAIGCSSGTGPDLASSSAGSGGAGGGGVGGGAADGGGGADPGDVDVPRFIDVNYLDIAKIASISRFRSAVGHDFSDSAETCRSMKHYFVPSVADWTTMEIRSPVDGSVAYIHARTTFGTQVGIQPADQPSFVVRLFHVHLADSVKEGDPVTAGQVLGTHESNDTMSDVAIELDRPDGYRLVSYALALSDAAFAELAARGVPDREALVISRAERDADPLGCAADGSFTDTGSLDDWVDLP